MDTTRRVELLRTTQFLREAPEELLEKLAGHCEEIALEPDQILFRQGDPGDALYVVDDGILEIFLGDTHLDESGRGECLGEMALLTDEVRSASIRSKEEASLLKLPKDAFRAALEENRDLSLGVIRELASKVKSSIRVRVKQHKFTVRLEEAFARSVSRSVMDAILGSRDPDKHVQGTIKQVTALYTDIRAFQSLWERVEPEKLINILNEFLQGMAEVVLENGGTIDRFLGDGILAHFGAPLSGKRDAWSAVQCGMQMHQKLADLNQKGSYVASQPLTMGVGLATGNVIAGFMGSERRMEYTAIGDVINLATGVESVTADFGADLLLCDETARQIGSDLLLREVDRVRLKGRSRPTHVYDVLAVPEEATPDDIRLLRDYRLAFALYAAGRFDEAALEFRAIAASFPEDGPSTTLAGRCERLRTQLPSNWECLYIPGQS